MSAKVKIRDLAPGAVFDIGPVKAVVLEHFADGKTLLAATEPIGNRPFTVRPFTFRRADPEPAANNFAFSTLREDLNTDFLGAVDAAGVIPADKIREAAWNLSDHLGGAGYGYVACKVAMLTEVMARKYYDAGLLEIDDWEWTITPYAGSASGARFVISDGSLGGSSAWNGHGGVRPALFVDSDICLSLEEDEVDLADSVLLGEFTSRQLVEEVLRRIATGEEGGADE